MHSFSSSGDPGFFCSTDVALGSPSDCPGEAAGKCGGHIDQHRWNQAQAGFNCPSKHFRPIFRTATPFWSQQLLRLETHWRKRTVSSVAGFMVGFPRRQKKTCCHPMEMDLPTLAVCVPVSLLCLQRSDVELPRCWGWWPLCPLSQAQEFQFWFLNT